MKRMILPLAIAIIVFSGCNNKKPVDFTILGDGTPYSNSPERMIGKVKTVVERNFWAIPDGVNFKKGNPLTKTDRDSLGGWTDDFEAVYDINGVIALCTGLNESGNSTWRNESIIENKLVARRNFINKDTLRFYDKFKYDDKGLLIGGSRYRNGADTLMISVTVKTNSVGYPTEFQLFNSKGAAIEKYVSTFDGQNLFKRLEVSGKDGKIIYSLEVKYNDKNKVSDLVIWDKDNKTTGTNAFTYEYDNKGNWVRAIVKDQKNKVVIEERSYTYF
jgi:hypothetical protein